MCTKLLIAGIRTRMPEDTAIVANDVLDAINRNEKELYTYIDAP
jgi:hypothetical protein